MLAESCFLTGTGTGVGKTYVAALWVRALRERGLRAAGFKPICCGDREDAETLIEASGGHLALDEVNPVHYPEPLAPSVAAERSGMPVDSGKILAAWERLRARHDAVIVEGVGGWLVPISREQTVADLAARMDLPVVVVVRNVLGAINHALLTRESIERRGLRCAGWVLNSADPDEDPRVTESNGRAIEECSGIPLLFDVGPGQRRLFQR